MLMGIQFYTIGEGRMPEWVADKVIPFKMMDGSTAYELHGAVKD